jgi:hypothetical protein
VGRVADWIALDVQAVTNNVPLFLPSYEGAIELGLAVGRQGRQQTCGVLKRIERRRQSGFR